MSAITGIFYRDGNSVSEKEIKKMNDCLFHRGPDGKGVWSEGSVALGHQMLHTTNESLMEKLPYHENTGIVITADARIDNRSELSKLLNLEDKIHISDSLFILKAYEKWGERCPEKLLGDFTFAIWDKNECKLFCARDHMGVKPFYYYLSDEIFFFSTEIKAILAMPCVSRKINEKKVAFHFCFLDDKKSTFYKDICRLPNAHSLSLTYDKIKIKKFWELDPKFQIELDSDQDYINAFREIFTESVRCRLRSATPLGFELSGGLDSSSVVCLTKKILENNNESSKFPLKTFSFIFKDFPDADEHYYINEIIKTGGISSNFLFANEISPLDQVESILWNVEEPFNYPNVAIMWNLAKKEQKMDVRIVLTGEGGDSVISKGQKYFSELAINMKWKQLFREMKATSNNFKKDQMLYNQSHDTNYLRNKSFYHLLMQNVLIPMIPGVLKKILIPFYHMKNRTNVSSYFLNKEFVERTKIEELLKDQKVDEERIKTSKNYHYHIINSHFHQALFELSDHLAAAFYIEKRHPFYDKRLIEFCYAIPTEMKFKFGWDRYILRRGMDDILPDKIQWRFSKQDYLPPLQENLIFYEKKILDEIIYRNNEVIEDYVDLKIFESIYSNYVSQNLKPRHNNSLEEIMNAVNIWLGTILYLWLLKSVMDTNLNPQKYK